MSKWKLILSPDAEDDLDGFDKSRRDQIVRTMIRVSQNPLPNTEGGYGKPLRGELSGCLKVKFLRLGVRVVYRLRRTERGMEVIVVGARTGSEVYAVAAERLKKMRKS